MAKQNGPFIFEMTVAGVSFYKRCGLGYVRMKSNLTRERWQADPAFAGSRKSAENMAQASTLASQYYQTIPLSQRSYPVYRGLVGIGQQMLSAGFSIDQVIQVLNLAVHKYLRKLATDAARAMGLPIRSTFAASHPLNTKPRFIRKAFKTNTLSAVPAHETSEAAYILSHRCFQPRGMPPPMASLKGHSTLTAASSATPMAGISMPIPSAFCPQPGKTAH